MKRIALTSFTLMIAVFAIAQELAMVTRATPKITAENAVFNWSVKEFDFGKVKVGIPIAHEFSFTNTGNVPLVISSVQASCGCTVTSYTKEPIEAGGTGFVKATYDAAKTGRFSKTVTVNANTDEGAVILTIKGEVVE